MSFAFASGRGDERGVPRAASSPMLLASTFAHAGIVAAALFAIEGSRARGDVTAVGTIVELAMSLASPTQSVAATSPPTPTVQSTVPPSEVVIEASDPAEADIVEARPVTTPDSLQAMVNVPAPDGVPQVDPQTLVRPAAPDPSNAPMTPEPRAQKPLEIPKPVRPPTPDPPRHAATPTPRTQTMVPVKPPAVTNSTAPSSRPGTAAAATAGTAAGGGGEAATPAPGPILARNWQYLRPPPAPVYPPQAIERNLQGVVVVRALVSRSGRPEQVRIHNSSGYDMLDRAATEAVQRYEFLPIRQGDMVVVAWVEIPIRFQLR
jgi:TonB family protein